MQVIVIDKNNLQAFTQLLGDKIGSGGALEQLKNLNPHVNFKKKIEPGTVLLIPDALGFHDAESFSVTGHAFDALREQMLASVDAAASRLRGGYEALLTEQKEVAVVLKSAAVNRAVKADPDLKPQIEAATQVFKQDQQQAKDAEKTMQTLREQAAVELASLAQLPG
jgi:hypothetical protein